LLLSAEPSHLEQRFELLMPFRCGCSLPTGKASGRWVTSPGTASAFLGAVTTWSVAVTGDGNAPAIAGPDALTPCEWSEFCGFSRPGRCIME
jgi:hypothetical protein